MEHSNSSLCIVSFNALATAAQLSFFVMWKLEGWLSELGMRKIGIEKTDVVEYTIDLS